MVQVEGVGGVADGIGAETRDELLETGCAKVNATKRRSTSSENVFFTGKCIATILQSFEYNLHNIIYFRSSLQEYDMNRLLSVMLIFLLLLFLGSLYLFIPSVLQVTSIVSVKCNPDGAARILGEDSSWRNRWQGGRVSGYNYELRGKNILEMNILVKRGIDSVLSRLTILTIGDSIALQWRYRCKTSVNPFRRVQQYNQAVHNKDMMDTVLGRIRVFLGDSRNIYGIAMLDSMSRDSALLIIRLQTAAYPSTAEIYGALAKIRAYAKAEGARVINYPLLHVSAENGVYKSIAGLSVDRRLKGTDLIEPKRYVPWRIVVGEVNGGVYTAEQAMVRLQEYISDSRRAAMGLPFQSLVTERDREPDTTRWVTRVVQAVP